MRLLSLICLLLIGSLFATPSSAAERHPLKKIRAKVLASACRSCR